MAQKNNEVRRVANCAEILSTATAALGSLKKPFFHDVSSRMSLGWGRYFHSSVFHNYWIKDVTDNNTDSGHFLDIADGEQRFLCAISEVGPYWALAKFVGEAARSFSPIWSLEPVDFETAAVQQLSKFMTQKLLYCEHQTLSWPVEFDIRENSNAVPLYRVIFSFEQDLPFWD